MLVFDVGTGGEVAHQRHAAIDDAGDRQVDRPQGAGAGADGGANLRFAGHLQRACHLLQIGGLDFVQLVVAAHDQGNQLALLGGMHHQGLDGLLDGQAEALHQGVDGLGVGGVDQAHVLGRGSALFLARHGFGLLDVGGVVGDVAEGDIVFAGLGQHVKLVGAGAADRAGIGLYGAEVQAQAAEHVAVGLMHAVIGFLQGRLVGMEGVGVLHDELATTHQTEARTDLVTELGLDLVHVDRQLLVAVQLVAGQVGDDLFMGRADAEFALVTIFDPQQLGAVLHPATGLLPQLGRLNGRHQHFQRTSCIHFLAHHVLDLAQHAQAHRQPGV